MAGNRVDRVGSAASLTGPHSGVNPRAPRWDYHAKALQTRDQILDVSRQLFLERGYAGTSIAAIATACDVSRGAVYTYFTSKLEIFDVLGTSTYKHQVAVIERLADLPRGSSVGDVRDWVVEYHEFMREEGAFMLASSHGGPDDPEFRARVMELTVRTTRRCGRIIQAHSGRRGAPPEAVGLVAMSALERSWSYLHVIGLGAVSDTDVIDAAAETIHAMMTVSNQCDTDAPN